MLLPNKALKLELPNSDIYLSFIITTPSGKAERSFLNRSNSAFYSMTLSSTILLVDLIKVLGVNGSLGFYYLGLSTLLYHIKNEWMSIKDIVSIM